jgi:hypothetical protein
MLIALAAGLAGSFIHGAQSLSSYLGNEQFKLSWAPWYILRPWIGGILGIAVYVTFRAGLVGGASLVNPYAVVALGLLGGWFSKTTADKLQEVFETLFKTDEDKNRKDKLVAEQPVIEAITPSPVPAGQNELVITGNDFQKRAKFVINGHELETRFDSSSQLRVTITPAARPAAGATVSVQIKNPNGDEPLSDGRDLRFD